MIDLHPGTADHQYHLNSIVKLIFGLDMVKDDSTSHSGTADQNIT